MYRCDGAKGCDWEGSDLAYVGFTPLPIRVSAGQYTNGQGVCPQCGRPIDGATHPVSSPDSREGTLTDMLRVVEGEGGTHMRHVDAAIWKALRPTQGGYQEAWFARNIPVGTYVLGGWGRVIITLPSDAEPLDRWTRLIPRTEG